MGRWTGRTLAAMGGALVAATLAACGGDDEQSRQSAEPSRDAGLGAIKSYLTDHTADLKASTAELARQGRSYYELAKGASFDYEELLSEHRDEVAGLVRGMQETWREANPQYEEAEGVVAGVEELSEFDVILDAGSDGSDPENAVPFDVHLPDGRVLKKPGNFFFLTETSLFGTNEDFQARDVRADLDGDGKASFGEAVPDANVVAAVNRDFAKQAAALDKAARSWTPTREDALQALVTMTPTMSEYFGQWKNSRFIAGSKAKEEGFAASSRLQDIEDILSGLVLVYENVRPAVDEVDPSQAAQTGRELRRLRAFAARLRAREQGGTQFTAEQAESLGAEAQSRAEAIAGQVSQAAAQLGIELKA